MKRALASHCTHCGRPITVYSLYGESVCAACKRQIAKAAAKFAPIPPHDPPTRVVNSKGLRIEFRGHCPCANLFKY